MKALKTVGTVLIKLTIYPLVNAIPYRECIFQQDRFIPNGKVWGTQYKMQLRNFFRKPPSYVLASVLCSTGGLLFGMDTGIIGPVTVMKSFTSDFGSQTATVHGLIVSSILIPAAISSFFAGRLADVSGRPMSIAIGSLIFGAGAALEAAAHHLAMFIIGRVIEGIGEGLYLGILVVYICEISPPKQRGALTTGPQLFITVGLVVGFFVCYGTVNINSSISWRLPFILLAGLSMTFSLAVLTYLPPSPRWLSLRGRHSETTHAWESLGVNPADREQAEDQLISETVELSGSSTTISIADAQAIGDVHKDASFLEVFSRESRPRLLLAVFMMGMQQLSGIDGVLYAGLASAQATFLASGVSAIVIFAVTIPALIWADKWGRRQNTILGGIGISITMFLIGILYASNSVHGNHGAGRWVVLVAIYMFAVIFSLSWAVCIKIYAAEIQSQRTRASATSLAHGSNWLTNFLVALTTPILLSRSNSGAYFLFGSCTLLTGFVCWIYMPETRGKTLDEIERAFKSRASHSQNIMAFVRRTIHRGSASGA